MTKEELFSAINFAVDIALNPADTDCQLPFKSLGIDSLGFYNILIEIESRSGVKIPDEAVSKMLTINDLLVYVKDVKS